MYKDILSKPLELGKLAQKLPHQPRPGHRPITFHGPFGDTKDLGRLFNAHPRKEAHFDDLRLAMIELVEPFKGLVEGENFLFTLGGERDGFVERNAARPTAALLPLLLPGVINQDSADRLGADGEEMRAALPINAGLIDQLEIRLVDQCGGLQRMIRPLAPKMPRGKGTEFIINKRHELGGSRSAVAVFHADEKFGDFSRSHNCNYAIPISRL